MVDLTKTISIVIYNARSFYWPFSSKSFPLGLVEIVVVEKKIKINATKLKTQLFIKTIVPNLCARAMKTFVRYFLAKTAELRS